MTPDMPWAYALAPDVAVHATSGGAWLSTATSRMWLDKPVDLRTLEVLAAEGPTRAGIETRLCPSEAETGIATECNALLYQLDRLGLLMRTVTGGQCRLASCVPLRPPPPHPVEYPPEGLFRLSPH